MATKVAKIYKEIGDTFTGREEFVKLTYDFSQDTGAFADDWQLGQASRQVLITRAFVHVETACTSAGSATVAIGTTSDVDAFLDATSGAVASLTEDAVIYETTAQHIMAADDYFVLDVGTADLTAGKLHVYVWFVRAD